MLSLFPGIGSQLSTALKAMTQQTRPWPWLQVSEDMRLPESATHGRETNLLTPGLLHVVVPLSVVSFGLSSLGMPNGSSTHCDTIGVPGAMFVYSIPRLC